MFSKVFVGGGGDGCVVVVLDPGVLGAPVVVDPSASLATASVCAFFLFLRFFAFLAADTLFLPVEDFFCFFD